MCEENLRGQIKKVAASCINCKFCQEECAFLKKYGKPKEIAERYDPSDNVHQAMAFECSLCGLCEAVCPVNVKPAEMFREMRREAVRSGVADYSEHAAIVNYEKRGTSNRYTYYSLPDGCDTIFFPGCTLPGTRPDKTFALYRHIGKTIPTLGIVLDCCAKPSHDLGRQSYFRAMFGEMKDFLVRSGVRQVLVACPNCYEIFDSYGKPLSVRTIYEFMAENGLPETGNTTGTVTIHDPCPIRNRPSIHSAVRELCAKRGLSIVEMPHHGNKTICCGEGGAVGFVSPDIAKTWTNLRKDEAKGNRVITYCAGCANYLNRLTPADHLIDLVFDPLTVMNGKAGVSKPPITYLNRLLLKRRIRKTSDASVVRERTFRKIFPSRK